MKQLIEKWRTILANRYVGWGTRWQNTNEPMTKNPKDTSRTCNSHTLKSQSEQDSIYQSNGSNALTLVTSPAIQLMMAHKTLCTSYPSTHPHYHQMICQLDQFHNGSTASSLDRTPNSYKWLKVQGRWTIGESRPISSDTENMMKSTRKSTQKSTSSSWTPPLLSKIVPCASKGLRLPGALKVLLTLKGWVPSPPVPSGAHTSQTMKKTMMKGPMLNTIAEDCNSEEEVMKRP
jgi:hypothetical protein